MKNVSLPGQAASPAAQPLLFMLVLLAFFVLHPAKAQPQNNYKALYLAELAKNTGALDPTKALRIAQQAYLLDSASPLVWQALMQPVSANSAFYSLCLNHEAAFTGACFSPDGRLILTTDVNNQAQLWDRKGKLLHNLTGHRSLISSATFSPDGNYVLTAAYDSLVRLWDINGRLLHTFTAHDSRISSATFSPDSKYVLTTAYGPIVSLWDIKGQLLQSIENENGEPVTLAVFSPSGKQILITGPENSSLRDVQGKLISRMNARASGFSPDGSQVLSADGNHILLWDSSGRLLQRFPQKTPQWKAFSPDGNSIATLTAGNQLNFYHAHNGVLFDSMQLGNQMPSRLVFSPDGRYLLGQMDDNSINIWKTDGLYREYPVFVLRAHQQPINEVIFSPDSRQVLSVSFDKTARLWELSHPLSVAMEEHDRGVHALDISSDGKRIVSLGGDYTGRLWDRQGRLIKQLDAELSADDISFSPDASQLLSISSHPGDAAVIRWDSTGKLLEKLPHPKKSMVNTACFSPDGKYILTTCNDGLARLWGPKAKVICRFQHQAEVVSACFSPDGQQILTASADRSARLWSLNGQLLHTFDHGQPLSTAIFSPDGTQIISGASDGSIRWWTREGKLLRSAQQHRHPVNRLLFSPDGAWLASLSETYSACLWDKNGKLLQKTDFPPEPCQFVFSPDGKFYLIASGNDIFLYHISGQLIGRLAGHQEWIDAVLFSPDSRHIISASSDSSIRIWPLPQTVAQWLESANMAALSTQEKRDWKID